MMIELRQDKVLETYVTKAKQCIDNFGIYLYITNKEEYKKEIESVENLQLLVVFFLDLSTNS